MNAVSNLSGISTTHALSRSNKSGTSSHTRFQLNGRLTPTSAHSAIPTFLSARAVRLYLFTVAILIAFFAGVIVHMVSGGDEVQAASLPSSDYGASAAAGSSKAILGVTDSAQADKPQVIVGEGDTLWSIAENHISKSQDIRAYIEKIKHTNHLTSSALRAGQVLQLP